MDELLAPRFGHRVLRVLIALLILAGAVFIWRFTAHQLEQHHRYRDERYLLLDRAYRLRRREILREYDRKIREAPDEVVSIQYQQERWLKLEEAQNRYFRDKEALRRGEGEEWRRHWADQIEALRKNPETGLSDEFESSNPDY